MVTFVFHQVASKVPSSSRNQLALALLLYLVQRGADINIRDTKGNTPLDCVDEGATRTFIEK